MKSSENEKKIINQEKLIYLKWLKNQSRMDQQHIFDTLIKLKTRLWAEVPASLETYLKTIYYDHTGQVVDRDYRLIPVTKLVAYVEESFIIDFDGLLHSGLRYSTDVAKVSDGCLKTYSEDRSVLVVMPTIKLTNGSHGLDMPRHFRRRNHTRKYIYVFSKSKAGEVNDGLINNIDEMTVDVYLENLMILEKDIPEMIGNILADLKKLEDFVGQDWVSRSLNVLNRVAFNYKGYRNANDETNGYSKKYIIRTELSERLSITNPQKLDNAFYIVSGNWHWYRKGIFGKTADGQITLLEAINRLSEINHIAKTTDVCRDYFKSSSYIANEKYLTEGDDELSKCDRIFKSRNESVGDFQVWIENEMDVFKGKKLGAMCKHISEFLRN